MRQIPVDVSDFKAIRDNNMLYVDKSMLIGDILKNGITGYHAVLRPRRLGKSVNLSMLDAFFNLKYKGNAWFDGLEISKHSEFDKHKNAYPVINVDFGGLEYGKGIEGFVKSFGRRIGEAYKPFGYLMDNDKIRDWNEKDYASIVAGEAGIAKLEHSLSGLSDMLQEYHDTYAVLLVDNYDAPRRESHGTEMQDEVSEINLYTLSSALKGCSSLGLGIGTGPLLMMDDSRFGGALNNLRVETTIDHRHIVDRYGFTEREVRAICEECGRPEKFDEAWRLHSVCYVGDTEVCDMQGIMDYAANGFEPAPCREDAYGPRVIGDFLGKADGWRDMDYLIALCSGEGISSGMRPHRSCRMLYDDMHSMCTLLAMAGYLKAVPEKKYATSGREYCMFHIPNDELYSMFAAAAARHVGGEGVRVRLEALARAMADGDSDAVCGGVEPLLDAATESGALGAAAKSREDDEKACRMLLVGLLTHLAGRYRAEDDYRDDKNYLMMLERRDGRGPNVAMEIRRPKGKSERAMRNAAKAALAQAKKEWKAKKPGKPAIAFGAAVGESGACVLSDLL